MDSVFKGKGSYADFSYDLRDKRDWKLSTIREVEYLSDVTAFAIEPTNGLIAIGTKYGKILIFGAPSVGTILKVSRGASVKFIQFAVLVFKLVCIDDRGVLHVWDLSQLGRPKFVTSEAYQEQACALATSPCHSHAFIGLQRRAILTYDILCLHRSPYVIPDVWSTHEQESVKHGMLMVPMSDAADIMDIVPHPRDLNNVFIACAGGVVLFDITERRALHHYSLIIPPGAPGAADYHDRDILQPRRPPLSALAVHSSGQLFATGHVDGSIAFWAVDDEDRPLMVRTIEKIDVNYPDAEELDRALSGEQSSSSSGSQYPGLEPVFKLSWGSFGTQALRDPYSACSTLVILGGALPGFGASITSIEIPPILLPAPSSPTRDAIHPEVRKALSSSLSSNKVYGYKTTGTAVDFQLVPKDNPHLSGNFNAFAILILTDSPSGVRTLEAKEFPPPEFTISSSSATPTPSSTDQEVSDPIDKDLASTLKSLKLSSNPKDLTYALPPATWSGMNAICDGDMVRLDKEEYERLLQSEAASGDKYDECIGKGGIAWVDYSDEDQAGDLMFTKRQAHRLLITHHRDLSIRFQDISPQLLIGSASSPLTTPFPAPFPQLTISLLEVLSDPHVATASGLTPSQVEIQSAQLTSESTECVVVLRSGHVIVFTYEVRERKLSEFVDDRGDVLRLEHIAAKAYSFQPKIMIKGTFGRVTCSELSNIGFFAIAYSTGTIIIIDLRGPEIIHRFDAKSQKRISVALHLQDSSAEKQIVSLRWFVSGYDEEELPRVRLLACHRSGTVRIFTLAQPTNRTWSVAEDIQKLEGSEHPLPRGSFVISAKNGASRIATRQTFAEALQGRTSSPRSKDEKGTHCFWISVGEKGAKCTANFTGSRVGRVEWGKGRNVECAEVINRAGAQALVAIMDTREVLVYTLPTLDPLHSFQLPKQPNSAISLDDTGDYIDWTFDENMQTVCRATLGTLFAIRRVYDEPVIDFTAGRRAPPAMPQPVPLAPISYLGSWFNFKKSISGDALDALLAGPNRPIPKDATTSSVVNGQWQTQLQNRVQILANQASQTGSNLYNNLTSAMGERGEMLSGLEERFRSLGDGGRKMMFEAKKMAAEQTGKKWLGLG